MPVTAGNISIARRIYTDDCSHKEAKVELHYTAEGDEDIKVLGAKAAHAALIHLEQVLATVVKIDHTPVIHVDAPEARPDMGDENEAGRSIVNALRRRRRTKAEMEADRVAVEAPADPMLPFVASGNSAETLVADASTSPTVVLPEVAWADEITDKALNNACNETMHRIKNKAKIQAVISEYTQSTVSTIPQSARAEFMQKLLGLQP